MGFSGAGYTTDPVSSVQNYIASRWSSIAPDDLVTQLDATLTSLGASGSTVLTSFFGSYGEAQRLPQNIDDFVAALIAKVPSGLGFTVGVQGAQLKAVIENTIKGNLSLEDAGFDQATIALAIGDPALVPHSATFYQDVYDSAFKKFLSEFDYTGATINGSLPTVVSGLSYVNTNYFGSRFGEFFFKFATVVNPGNTSVNFEDIYAAFFGTGNPNFASFLANYIKNNLYPTTGDGSFLPNENIGDWMQKVQQSYSLALSGAAAPTTSSVGDSVKRAHIIDIVIQLIIKMIGTLQKVAAMQSDRLRVLTNWQSAYTDLQSQVPTFTQGDGTIFGRSDLTSKDEAQKARDQANNFNQTMTETIRSRRTTVQDDAKVLQSNINQSNDSANDQASTATALIQTLSTLLGAIYR